MSIIRISKREHPYAQIDKRILEDARLSWRAKGVICYLLSKPDNWQISIKDIWNKGKEGRNAVQEVMAELEKYGYASLEVSQDKNGVFTGKMWTVTEEPKIGFSVATDKPEMDEPKNRKSGFRLHSNNDINSNNEYSERVSEKKSLTSPAPSQAENFFPSEQEENLKVPGGGGGAAGANYIVTTTDADALPGSLVRVAEHVVFPGSPSNPISATYRTDLPQRAADGDEAEAIITAWTALNIETVKNKYSEAKRAFAGEDLQKLIVIFCGQYSSHADSGTMQRFLSDPALFFKNKLSSWLMNQSRFDKMAEPRVPSADAPKPVHSRIPRY